MEAADRHGGGMSESNNYQAFGLSIQSDLRLPELPAAATAKAEDPDVTIECGDRSLWPSLEANRHCTPTLELMPGEWRLTLEGIGWFRASGGQRLQWQRWDENVNDRDIRTFLTTSGLGALMIQRGSLALHATTLCKNGKSILLLGSPAVGKTTLAWCLLQQGWSLLSSELSVINSDGTISPGLQQLKLWQDSATGLGINWEGLPVVREGLKRYSLLPPAIRTTSTKVSLEYVYEIERTRSSTDQSDTGIKIYPTRSEQASLMRIRNQAFHPRFYRGMNQEAKLFTQASSLIKTTTGYGLQVPGKITELKKAVKEIDLLHPNAHLAA